MNQNNVVISFEEAAPPNFVSVQNGSIKNTALRSRYGDKSLEWKWTTASSTLIIDNAPGMDYTKSKDQILMWIYNETPMPDTSKKLVFRAGSKATMKDADPNNDQYFEFDFFLNFKGWRAMGINLQEEGTWKGKESYAIKRVRESFYFDYLEIHTPESLTSGRFFVDMAIFGEPPVNGVPDLQMPYLFPEKEGRWQIAWKALQHQPKAVDLPEYSEALRKKR